MLLSTLYPVPATVPQLATANIFTTTNTFARVITGGRTSNVTYDLLSLAASITGIDVGSTGLTSIGDILVGKASAVIGIGSNNTTRWGGIANYSNTFSDVGLFCENSGGTIRLRPDGRLSSTGQLLVTTSAVTYAGNTMWHAGNFTPANYLTTATAATTYVSRTGSNTLPTGDWRILMDSADGSDTGIIRLYASSAFSASRTAILELNGLNTATNPCAFRLLSSGASQISAGTLLLSAPVTVASSLTVSTGGLSVVAGGITAAGGLNISQGTATFAGASIFNSTATFNNPVTLNAASTVTSGSFRIQGWTSDNTQGVLYLSAGDNYIYKTTGGFTFNSTAPSFSATLNSGGTIWTTGNFDPNTKANLTGAAFTGQVSTSSNLVVGGTLYFSSGSEAQLFFQWDNYYLFNNLQNMGFYSASGYLLQMRKSDRYVLATDFAISSDSRIKEHLEFLNPEDQLSKLMQVRTRKYIKNGVSVEYGTYAQELMQIWPEMVTTDEAFGYSDFHTVNTNMLHATHIAATQALCLRQRTDHSDLQLRVQELEHRVETQARIIAQLVK